jgi:hypothetical protein
MRYRSLVNSLDRDSTGQKSASRRSPLISSKPVSGNADPVAGSWCGNRRNHHCRPWASSAWYSPFGEFEITLSSLEIALRTRLLFGRTLQLC